MNELISVIVPVYNVEKYLQRCVESLLAQTYTNLEIILVDDGSEDSSPQLCDAYEIKDQRVRVIHKENGGLSDARNAGLQIATGEYLSFIDSDDFVREDMYEVMLYEMQRNKVDLLKSDFINFSNESQLENENKDYAITLYTPLEALKDFMETEYSARKHMKSTACDALYRRCIFFEESELILKYPVGKINEDTYVFPKVIFRANRIAHINVPFYYYYIRSGSIIHSTLNKREIESRDLWKQIDKDISNYTEKYHQRCVLNWAKRYILLLNKVYVSEYKEAYFEKILQELLEDKKYLLEKLEDKRVRRTIKLIRYYRIYRVAKFVGKKFFF